MIKAIPVAIPMNEESPWGLGRRYMPTSTNVNRDINSCS